MKPLDEITGAIVDVAMKAHSKLGPGLLETVYEVVIAKALERRGLDIERQKRVGFEFDGMVFEDAFRADLVVENQVIVELKSLEALSAVHFKQLNTYLRLMQLPVGFLINFGAASLRDGLHRRVNGLKPANSPALRVNRPL